MAVVDLVRAGVEQVFALQINFRAAQFAGEPFGEVERRGPSAEFLQVIFELALKLRILLRAEIFILELLQRMHQGLGHEAPAVGTEVAAGIGHDSIGGSTHKLCQSPANGRRGKRICSRLRRGTTQARLQPARTVGEAPEAPAEEERCDAQSEREDGGLGHGDDVVDRDRFAFYHFEMQVCVPHTVKVYRPGSLVERVRKKHKRAERDFVNPRSRGQQHGKLRCLGAAGILK